MSKCRYDLSENCNNTDCLNCVLDKIKVDIQELRDCSCNNSDGIIDDVEDIIDKYKGESEE